MLIRRIRDLLYDQGFTISGARNRLSESSTANKKSATILDEVKVREEIKSILDLLAA